MRPFHAFSFLVVSLAAPAVQAQQITADRPGIGSDPEVVPQFTVQAEVGNDSHEVRLGVLRGLEVDRDDTSWGAKLALIDNAKLKLSFKASYDSDLHTVLEMPANYTFSDWFNLGTTIVWSRTAQTYAAEFNVTPTKTLTITPTLYYAAGTKAAIFAAWVLPGHPHWQVDLGYDQHKVSAGVSYALDLAALFKRHP